MKSLNKQPIGVFDSGIGGLTVVKALKKVLPYEDIVYFGDTARLPYGSKSSPTIIRFALQDAKFLVNRQVKMIIVACHSVSSVALPDLKKHFRLPIIGVIEPGAKAAVQASKNNCIGIIGTQATILAGAYERAIKNLNRQVEIVARSTPLFVPLAEQGWTTGPIALQIAKTYLTPMIGEKIDTLLLGCTHYPLLKNTIAKVFKQKVRIVDAALETALETKIILQAKKLLNPQKLAGTMKFYLSDLTPNFSSIGRQFLGADLTEVFRASISE
ncbi:MAG: glutamate racemase [Candidatus Latescibacteria bacterium]|nr:glutamate racemase [Candidatus Latescibacterota bacterium]